MSSKTISHKAVQTASPRHWIGLVVVYLSIPLILLVCGGDFGWWQAWVYSLLISAVGIGGRIWAEWRHPGMLAERQNIEHIKGVGFSRAKIGRKSRKSRTGPSGGAASGSRRHHQGGLRMVSCGKSGRERVVGADSGPVAWSPPAAAESRFLSLTSSPLCGAKPRCRKRSRPCSTSSTRSRTSVRKRPVPHPAR